MQAFSGLGRGRGPEGSPWRGTPVTYKSSLNPCFSLLPLEARKSMRASALKCCPRPHPFTREFLQHSSEGNVFVPFHCKKERNPRDFPGGPVVKTLCSQCRGPGLALWPESYIPHATTKDPMCACAVSLVMSDSLQPHGL